MSTAMVRPWRMSRAAFAAGALAGLLLLMAGCGGGGGGGGASEETADTTPPVVSASPAPGTYDTTITVTLVANETATIYYTTDGSDPTPDSPTYTDPIQLSQSTTLKYFAVDEAGNESPVTTAQYVLDLPFTVSGQVLFDDGDPVVGATVMVSLSDEAAREAVRAAKRAIWAREEYTRRGAKEAARSQKRTDRVALRLFGTQSVTTDDQGRYEVTLSSTEFPIYVLVQIRYEKQGYPAVDSSRWLDVGSPGDVAANPITVPDPEGREAARSGDTAVTPDGAVEISDLPDEVDRVFAVAFDPGDQSGDAPGEQAFPGGFAEMGNIPLDSSAYVWVEALDADGNPVSDLSQAVRIRARVPKSQWGDLEDITPGTDRIELPMYFFNEDTQMWEQGDEPGWLEAEDGTVLPEDAQSAILDGSYGQDVFASFTASHFSWMNVDYAYIGPWTLSRLSRAKRNNDCLYKAARLAEKIFRTSWANTAYADVNKPGTDLSTEVPDKGSTEFKDADLDDDTFGETRSSDFKELLYLNSKLWDNCDSHKKATIFAMAVTILHETAHWKHDAKKHDGTYASESDVGGEAGLRIENNLFGDSIWTSDGKLPVTTLKTGSGTTITDAHLDKLTDPQWWEDNENNFSADFWSRFWSGGSGSRLVAQAEGSDLEITLSFSPDEQVDAATLELGASVPVYLTYTNHGSAALRVLDPRKVRPDGLLLQGYPVYFEVTDANGAAVEFLGPKVKLSVGDEDFVELGPGQTMTKTVDLTWDAVRDVALFNFVHSGTYSVQALYAEYFGLPATSSNVITLTLTPGGSVRGLVTDSTNGQPLEDAEIRVIRPADQAVLATVTTGADGTYNIAELPRGEYTVEVRATGYLRTSAEISVTAGEETEANFSLSPLLATGEVRIVLTWGESPSDLDSHLWLPPTMPYHVYYSRRGSLDSCPYANLDVDDTTSFGPETITVTQRVTGGNYVYYVYNYSGSPDIAGSGAKVEVFDATGLVASFTVPETGSGTYWHVFDMDGDTGSITEINEVTETDPRPYLDTSAGCGEEPPVVSFTAAAQTLAENAGTATVTVSMDHSWPVDVTVPVSFAGTATQGAGADYTADVTGSLTIPADTTSASITLTINDDSEVEGDETVVLTLGTPDHGTLGATTQHTVTITDDD